ncbi:MAG: glycosyltransferase [Myxococcota bacterium]|nr:glycosyltransferase [Myxococcota bacterium]
MAVLHEVRVGVRPLEQFSPVVPKRHMREALKTALRARNRLAKRVVWNVNSTAVGGGVAEMLPSLCAYARSIGIDTRWLVIEGNPEFFRVTKRIHHALHGSAGDGSPLDEGAREIYEATLRRNATELVEMVREGDVVLLHDPQTAGLSQPLLNAGAHVVWRCHVGIDEPNEEAQRGWEFLRPYLEPVPRFVFSRQAYVPTFCDHGKAVVIQPSIDVFSPKNQELPEKAIHTILVHTGLVDGPPPDDADHGFLRDDGSPGRVGRRAEVVRLGRPPAWETPLVVQISRWDPLKDMKGVMLGFAKLCESECPVRAELVLAGPNVKGVTDDPEGADVFEEVVATWRTLPDAIRGRIHLASLPTDDVQENAAIVNALQRHAAIVVQKSLREGFGLTVTEAMWKGRPVVASGIGGIQDQIEHGKSGLLLKDPHDLDAFEADLCELLCDAEKLERMGTAARKRAQENFLGLDHLLKYSALLKEITETEEGNASR